jgi:hypothetical protein
VKGGERTDATVRQCEFYLKKNKETKKNKKKFKKKVVNEKSVKNKKN